MDFTSKNAEHQLRFPSEQNPFLIRGFLVLASRFRRRAKMPHAAVHFLTAVSLPRR